MQKTGDVVTPGPWGDVDPTGTMGWLANLLSEEGVNLMDITEEQLKRGTPVYVQANSDVLEVQRRMAHHHIRMLPVLADNAVIGVVDLVELAQRDDLGSEDQGPS